MPESERQPADGHGRPQPTRAVEAAVAVVVLAAAAWLRLVHLGTASLWWDEVVHLATASRATLLDVLREAKLGIPPGAGNAGAAPLDYLVLHLWVRLVPLPAPEHLEVYYRLPACAWAIAAVALMPALGRRVAGPVVGLLAAALLAGSVPHVLYAAEARFYSLFTFMAVLNLLAFVRVAEDDVSTRAWVLYAVVGVLFLLTGLLALVPLGVQWAALVVGRRGQGERRRHGASVAGVAAVAVLTGLVALAYLWGTRLGVRYGRPAHVTLAPLGQTFGALRFFAGGNDVLLALFVAGVGVLLLRAWRSRGPAPAVALAIVGAFATIPLVILVERWKEYYFHPRHVLFLLPSFALLAAVGIEAAARALLGRVRIRSGAAVLAAGMVVVVALAGPGVVRYLRYPLLPFAATKTVHEFAAVMPELARRVGAMPPFGRHLLVAERDSVANAVVSFYLRAWGLDRRVTFRGTRDVPGTLKALAEGCGAQCAGPRARALLQEADITVPVGLTPRFRALLGIGRGGPWPGLIRGYTVLAYSAVPPVDGVRRRRLPGVTVLEPVASRVAP